MTQNNPPSNYITVPQSPLQIAIPVKGRAYSIPESDWEYLREKVERIAPPPRLYEIVSSSAISIAGSALVGALTLPADLLIKNRIPANYLCWGLVFFSGLLGLLSYVFYRQQKDLMSFTKRMAIEEMERIEEQY